MIHRPIKHLLHLVLGCLLLSGCGFYLRGMVDAPLWIDDVAIIVQAANRALGPELKKQLTAYHIHVEAQPSNAKYWLIIESDHEEQHVTSVSSSTTPRQYQMSYQVKFKVQEAKGKEIIPSKSVITTRQLTVNSNRILGSNDEENTLKREMRQDAVIQIIARLGHYQP